MVERMLSNQNWAGKTASNGNEYVLRHFDWESVASKYEQLLSEMMIEFEGR